MGLVTTVVARANKNICRRSRGRVQRGDIPIKLDRLTTIFFGKVLYRGVSRVLDLQKRSKLFIEAYSEGGFEYVE